MHTDAGSGRCDDGPAGSAAEDGDLRSEGRGITSIAGSGLAGTRLGRLSISVVVVCVFASIVVANLPDSPTQDRLSPIAEPLVDGLGVRQGWAVFSPNPTSISVLLEARLTYDDGTTSTWRVPRGGPVLDSVRSERWRQIDQRRHALAPLPGILLWPSAFRQCCLVCQGTTHTQITVRPTEHCGG